MNDLTIDLSSITELARDGGKLIFNKSAEDSLVKLLQLKDYIEFHIEQVKKEILQAGQSIDPNFKGVIGQQIEAVYRAWGKKYEVEDDEKAREFISWEEKPVIDTKKIEEYDKKHGHPPAGIKERMRINTLSLQPTKYGKEKIAGVLQSSAMLETGESG